MASPPSITKEEASEEIADFVVADALKRAERGIRPIKPRLTSAMIKKITEPFGWTDKEFEDYIEYMKTEEGRQEFRKKIGFKLWMAGFRPKGWEESTTVS